MPKIISSTELRNSYNDVSQWCHGSREAAFVTRNGNGDLAVMSIDAYDEMTSRLALYDFIEEGRKDRLAGNVVPAPDVIAALRQEVEAVDVPGAVYA